MTTKFLSQTIKFDNNEYSDILNTVCKDLSERTTKVASITAASQYKFVSEAIQSAQVVVRPRKKNIKELMKQSFFHGASWMGENFIA